MNTNPDKEALIKEAERRYPYMDNSPSGAISKVKYNEHQDTARKAFIEGYEAARYHQSPVVERDESWPVQCSLDAQQCQQECEYKNNRNDCPFASRLPYRKEFLEYVNKYFTPPGESPSPQSGSET